MAPIAADSTSLGANQSAKIGDVICWQQITGDAPTESEHRSLTTLTIGQSDASAPDFSICSIDSIWFLLLLLQ